MVDIVDKEKRSEIMSKVRSFDTKPEMTVRRNLFAEGFRYRVHDKRLPGRPDIVLPRYKTAVFVNGCFWHGHDCPRRKLPSTNRQFWQKKIFSNVERDKMQHQALKTLGWQVRVIWQCNIKEDTEQLLEKLCEARLKSS